MTRSGSKPSTSLESSRSLPEADASTPVGGEIAAVEQITAPPVGSEPALVPARPDHPPGKTAEWPDEPYDGFLFTFTVQPLRSSAFEAVLEQIVFLLGVWHLHAVIESPFQPRYLHPPCVWYAFSDDPAVGQRRKSMPERSKRKARSVLVIMQVPKTAGLSQFFKEMITDHWMADLPGEVRGVDFEPVRLGVLSPTRTESRAPGPEDPFKLEGMLFYPLGRPLWRP